MGPETESDERQVCENCAKQMHRYPESEGDRRYAFTSVGPAEGRSEARPHI